ncbi:hypothetical protein QE152_g10170 [Popillia japonica]|uniref:Uncharacterized protein n=1 Tax=Popillia japonica TaxID=7064 RepID=A0AAW1LW44_POPJA
MGNVAGLMKKLKGGGGYKEDVTAYMEAFDVVGLVETWMQEAFDVVGLVETWMQEDEWKEGENLLPKVFKWKKQWAKREKERGRASGGILMGVRDSINEVTRAKEAVGEKGKRKRKGEWRNFNGSER